jgi:transcriptional regulator with XRE-family HTH domain
MERDSALVDLGLRLKEQRKAANLTQAALSARVGISRDTLSRAENGDSVETALVQRLAEALGCRLTLERAPLRAADMRRKYAHLHSEDEE